jgi:hypothetical protein
MSLIDYLQPQKIDDLADEFYDGQKLDDRIELSDQIDEDSLEKFWDKVVDDIHKDPDWFKFDDK